MTTPYNQYVLIEKRKEDAVSTSGIYTGKGEKEQYILIAGHDELKGFEVYLKEEPVKVEGTTYATPIDNIVAYTK